MTELRAFVYIDRMQPQYAAYVGANARGYLPVAGMAATFVEIAPGVLINQVADAAVKAANVRPGLIVRTAVRHPGSNTYGRITSTSAATSARRAAKTIGPSIESQWGGITQRFPSSASTTRVTPRRAHNQGPFLPFEQQENDLGPSQ
jgi:hypothetical protein